MDLSKILGIKAEEPQPEELQQEETRLTKEEYAALKKAEREDVWGRVDAQAQEVFRDDQSMREFLDFMANCTPQSARNLLILYEQNPEISHPRTFERWADYGRSVRTGEKGYTFFAEQDYEKEDGTKASGYVITKAFDISQTKGRPPLPPQHYEPEELLAAMIESSPVRMEISDKLPDNVQAQYVPKNKAIYVRNGMDETATFCAIAREQSHVHFDSVGSGYYRQAFAMQAYCAAYVLAAKNGFDTSGFQFDKVCKSCEEAEPQEMRGFISDIKAAAYAVSHEMRRSLRELEQTVKEDSFSMESGKAAAKEPKTKASKPKAEKAEKEEKTPDR